MATRGKSPTSFATPVSTASGPALPTSKSITNEDPIALSDRLALKLQIAPAVGKLLISEWTRFNWVGRKIKCWAPLAQLLLIRRGGYLLRQPGDCGGAEKVSL